MINPIFMIALPLLLAFLTMVFKKQKKLFLILAGIGNTVFAVSAIKGITIIGGFRPPYGINLLVDDFSYIAVILINVLFLAGILISLDLAEKYAPVLLTAIAGINGIILTGDLFNLFVFLEITTISAYILSSSTKRYRHSFNYLILGSVGAVFYLLGIVLLYSLTGSLNMADISVKIAGLTEKQLLVPILLIFGGLAVEAKLIPVSGWVKGVYSRADRLTGSLLSSIFAASILFVFGRIFAQTLPVSGKLKILMIILCGATFVFGELSAFKQVKVKKILMFSSVAQSGLAAALLLSGLVFPAVLLIINNAIGKLIMFSTAGAMEEKYGTDDYNKLKGVFLKNKLIGLAFTISALSIIGLPFFLGFYGKLNSLYGLFALNDYVLPAIILLMAIVEGAYFIKLVIGLWAPGEEGQEAKEEYAVKEIKLFNFGKVIIVFVLSLIILGAGIFPDSFGDLISKDHKLLNETGTAFELDIMKGGD